ncbi:glycogen debranching enzyme N-terminal domain-containing protein [bacterium]|nr:glycogen debranching enzyme N-terminal domain-containing protein [bacterium]
MEPLKIPKETCADYYYATQKEWLETNGIGGFASSTVIGANTRRYHGLLVASLRPPTHRFVLLSKMEESLNFNGKTYELSTNQYPFIIFPEGHKNIDCFEYDLYPKIIYRVHDIVIEKNILMIEGENSTILRYRLIKADQPVTLSLRPLCSFRDYHSLSKENTNINKNTDAGAYQFSIQPYPGLPRLSFHYNLGSVEPKFFWYKNTEYRKEHERGLDFTEDLFSHAIISATLHGGESLDILITCETNRASSLKSKDIGQLMNYEIQRRKAYTEHFPLRHPAAQSLALSADSFLVKRSGNRHTIIAGYHWFGDWGRDTMIALPGLTLTCKRYDVAKAILLSFAEYISQGMIPNRFPDLDETPEYNNVDGTLWFFVAAYRYWQATNDDGLIRTVLYERLADIIAWHVHGTRYNIKMEDDGLLYAGESGVQLTWMDAKIGDWVVTPRTGKCVEINALWYNALCIMHELSRALQQTDDAEKYKTMAEKTKNSFNEQFWFSEGNYLYDYINGEEKNGDVRPNQIFAVSLPFSLLDTDRCKLIIEKIQNELLTPYGLRTLSPSHPSYTGVYAGDPYHRDAAYHQGTVWPWLLGAFIEAYLKTHDGEAAKTFARTLIEPFATQLNDAGIGTISEIYDGDPPHFPKGCIAQAWSVAEILRIIELLEK